MSETIEIIDMTSFDQEFSEVEPCQRCNPDAPREAEFMVRFNHISREQQHILAYCPIHLFMVISEPAVLVCAACSPELEKVVYISHWSIRKHNAAS